MEARVSYNTVALATRQNNALNKKLTPPDTTFNTISDYLQLIRSGGQQLNRKPLFGPTSPFRQQQHQDESRLPSVQSSRDSPSLEAILSKFNSSDQSRRVHRAPCDDVIDQSRRHRTPCDDVTAHTYSSANAGASLRRLDDRTEPSDLEERKRTASQGQGEKKSPRISLAMRPIDGKTSVPGKILTGSLKCTSRAMLKCDTIMTCHRDFITRRDAIARTHAARLKQNNGTNSRNNSSISRDRSSANEWKRTENGNVVRKIRNRIPVWEVDNTVPSTAREETQGRSSTGDRPSSWMTSEINKVSSSNNNTSTKDKLFFNWDTLFSKPRLDSLLNTQTDVQRFRRLLRESTDEEATDARTNHCDALTTDRIETWLREVRRVRDSEGLCCNTADESLESEQQLVMTSSIVEES